MSNAKLKEQIEAAKIALVHSAEAGTLADTPPASGTVKHRSQVSTPIMPNPTLIAPRCRNAAIEDTSSPMPRRQ